MPNNPKPLQHHNHYHHHNSEFSDLKNTQDETKEDTSLNPFSGFKEKILKLFKHHKHPYYYDDEGIKLIFFIFKIYYRRHPYIT